MQVVTWNGSRFGPGDLFRFAREARARSWLGEGGRRFLYHAGVCLATDRSLTPEQSLQLDSLLSELRRLGSTLLQGAPAAVTPGSVETPPELEALERELASLRLFLAAATERVEAHWQRLQRHKQGLPPDSGPDFYI